MSSPELTEDDESFEEPRHPRRSTRVKNNSSTSKATVVQPKPKATPTMTIESSGGESDDIVEIVTSDEENDLPEVNLQKIQEAKDRVIKNLFEKTSKPQYKPYFNSKSNVVSNASISMQNLQSFAKKPLFDVVNYGKHKPSVSSTPPPPQPQTNNKENHRRMIGGVQVDFPVPPYGAQIALMSKVIEGMNKGLNCLLESPTGSGKTLALLCGALAWQQQEKKRVSALQAQQFVANYPECKDLYQYPTQEEVDLLHTGQVTLDPEALFAKKAFGGKSIYDSPSKALGNEPTAAPPDGTSNTIKRMEVDPDSEDSPESGLVTIHKRRRTGTEENSTNDSKTNNSDSKPHSSKLASPDSKSGTRRSSNFEISELDWSSDSKMATTPGKSTIASEQSSPFKVFETAQTMRVPTIYYGARTHKQIQQVVKEFSRTSYCGEAKMTVLSSREYSCLRPFDKTLYSSKNDMCRECVKKTTVERLSDKPVPKSNCAYFEHRQSLNHEALPPAFDLDDLNKAGLELMACPYYGARLMAPASQVIFCPYNYLIDPGIRSSLSINLQGEVVILDEAHNIEDICRDSATFTITREQITRAMGELEILAGYQYANQDIMNEINFILKCFKNWDDWFVNQKPLLNNAPVSNDEAAYKWQVEHFVKTLDNHNIGQAQYKEYKECAFAFALKWRDEPEKLFGTSQATASLVDTIDIVLGYLFREDSKYLDDFKPALIRTSVMSYDQNATGMWRDTQFNKSEKEHLSLRLMCMNPAVVFDSLKAARCIILSSGTLTPLVSLHSELGTKFPLQVSPSHVIPKERVWIGTLSTCPDGRPLECKSSGSSRPETQDALGSTVLWVCKATPHGVLCFLPSYHLMNRLYQRWEETGLWRKLNDTKHVFMENRNVKDHSDVMEDFYKYVSSPKGALLFAVYRGKVSEGMDFKDHQARAVITVGIPYPNTFDMMVKEKMSFNDRHVTDRGLLSGSEWLRVQAYRALNQAVGRCVRHRGDWGAVLLVDTRFSQRYYTDHLSKWLKNFLGNNHFTFEQLVNSPNSLESFMQAMTLQENEEVT